MWNIKQEILTCMTINKQIDSDRSENKGKSERNNDEWNINQDTLTYITINQETETAIGERIKEREKDI